MRALTSSVCTCERCALASSVYTCERLTFVMSLDSVANKVRSCTVLCYLIVFEFCRGISSSQTLVVVKFA